ncbi:endonuclease/exonuclease/phosphatase family protein [Carboxylicivirga sediminis]|uniref:Endonuclease/exonuclease/phosphatase family protein n=1 Tax=Carboxylicivirga sediminis TaxID=2006564 RepID=A0A941F751_9BACT|nr:endonuclease/exonuclease/phosphatase family protein [Carboxylicivirga sediminis]MBR8536540.1 endonuclease/exonuclease/phosphatase family protein [Carboxylicivirga sediminis]
MLRRFFKSVVTIISLIASGILLFSVLTAYISPAHTSVLAFIGYVFPTLWLINFVLFAFWLVKRRWQFLLPLLAIVITWGHWEHTFQWKGAKMDRKEMQAPLKVMSLNARMFDYYQWIGDNTNEKIFDFIREENPDVLCIQEFFTTSSNKSYTEHYILRRLNQFKYQHIEYLSGKKGKRNFGLITFSKYPIVEKYSVRFEQSNNFSIYSDIKIGEQRIRIFNNHLESIKFDREQLNFLDSLNYQNKKERNENIKAISSKLSKAFGNRALQAETVGKYIANSPYPPIVCGDFNDTPVSYVYRKMRGNLKDAFEESGQGFGGTYNGPLPSFRIDFIFHDNHFASYNFRRIKVDVSDHYPIVTTLELQPDREN